MDNLYSEDKRETYNAVGDALDKEAGALIRPLFKKYHDAGYSARQISHIIMGAAFEIELETLLDWNVEKEVDKNLNS